MISGLLGLVFNPAAWVAVALAFFAGFSGGVFKGWADSRADQYKTEIVELREASRRKDEIIKRDAELQLTHFREKTELEAQLNELLKGNSGCKLSDAELDGLRDLANGARRKRGG